MRDRASGRGSGADESGCLRKGRDVVGEGGNDEGAGTEEGCIRGVEHRASIARLLRADSSHEPKKSNYYSHHLHCSISLVNECTTRNCGHGRVKVIKESRVKIDYKQHTHTRFNGAPLVLFYDPLDP